MKKVHIEIDNLKLLLTDKNEAEIKRILYDVCEGSDIVTVVVGRDREEMKLEDLF